MGTIFFTSDLHFGHDNIIEFSQRPWDDIDAMNEALIENFNSCVTVHDVVYILGDFSFKLKKSNAKEILGRLHGNKHLICGNHDINWKRAGGFCSVHDILTIRKEGIDFVLSHYPMIEWVGDDKGAFMLHGHAHFGSYYNLRQRELGIRRFDVGVDANAYKPVALETILDFFREVPGRRAWPQALLQWNDTDFETIKHT